MVTCLTHGALLGGGEGGEGGKLDVEGGGEGGGLWNKMHRRGESPKVVKYSTNWLVGVAENTK